MNLIESETKRIRAAAFYDAAKIADMTGDALEESIRKEKDEILVGFARITLDKIRSIASDIRDAGRAQL